MAARPLRRAICAGAKKGAAVVPAVVALRTILPRYVLPLPRFCYKRGLSIRAVLLRRPFASRSFCFAVLLHCARLIAVLRRRVKRRVSSR